MTGNKVREDTDIPALIRIDAAGRRRIVCMKEADANQRAAFYQSLLQIAPEKVCLAIMQNQGRERRQRTTDSVTTGLWLAVETRKAEIRKNGARPRGGIREHALADIAGEHGITPAALKKRFQRRLTLTTKQRRYLKRPPGLSLPFVVEMVAEIQELARLRRLQRKGVTKV
jgi:hypothetical protein